MQIVITHNTIRDSGVGLHLTNKINVAPTISQINFINNTVAVQLEDVHSATTIPVSDSYWGTTDLGAISDLIYDNLDDYDLGTVQVVNPVASPIH